MLSTFPCCINSKMTEQTKRSSDPVLAELLQMVTEVSGILKSHMHDHDMNHQAIEMKLSDMHKDVSAANSGFPENDPIAHREFHAEYARKMKEKADFWRKMSFELGKYGLLGFFGWAAYALWQAFLHGPGR